MDEIRAKILSIDYSIKYLNFEFKTFSLIPKNNLSQTYRITDYFKSDTF